MNSQNIDWDAMWTNDNAESRAARKYLWQHVLAPTKQAIGKSLKSADAQTLLRICFGRAEKLFSKICRRRSLEVWLPMARSLSGKVRRIDNFETYLTLGLMKYCSLSASDVHSAGWQDSSFGITLPVSPSDLLDAERLAYLAFLMAAIGNAYRRVGKGSVLKATEVFPLDDEAPDLVALAMKSYDARRSQGELFRDKGIMHNAPLEPAEFYFIATVTAAKGMRFVVPEWQGSWSCVRLPSPFEAQPSIRILEGYRAAIEDIHKVPLESLFHFLSGLAALTSRSIPVLEMSGGQDIRLRPREGDDEIAWKRDVGFLVGFSQKGYFRFPLKHWLNVMAKVRSPWATDDQESRRRTEQCLLGFSVNVSNQDSIDLSAMRPMPFCFKSPDDRVYVDVQATGDFLRSLVDAGKEWFTTQGGDRFTLAVKRRVETERPEVKVVGWKQEIPVNGKHPVECDLLLGFVQEEVRDIRR